MALTKSTLYLHIGMHKTGSTSIQQTLDGYRGEGVHYAEFGSCNHGIAAKTVFCRDRHDYHYHQNRGLSAADIDRLAVQWRDALNRSIEGCPGNLVISGEDLCHIGRDDLPSVRDYFAAHFDVIQVIAYVREPVGFCSSIFQQVVRGGLTDFTVPLPDYRARFEKYLDVFGADNVEFVKHSRDELFNGCVVEDFARRVGVDLADTKKVTTNEALPRQAVALAYRHNRSGLIKPGDKAVVIARTRALDQLAELFDDRFLLSEALVREALDTSDVDWMERVAGFSLSPSTATQSAAAIASEADLLTAAAQAEPQLRAWLAAHGYDAHAESPMHALVMGLLSES